MLFNSYEFLLFFLPTMVLGFYLLQKTSRNGISLIWLSLGSLFYYAWWNPSYLPLVLISIGFNYFQGIKLSEMHDGFAKKTYLILGVGLNLGLLAYFKYTDFFIENINLIFSTVFQEQNVVLPLAISFFTFQQIAFLVDSYRGVVKDRNPLNYALFVSFFPQLIAGPIVHHKEMMPQFSEKLRSIDFDKMAQGLSLLSIGLFKKVMIADSLSPIVRQGFDQATNLSFIEGWVTSCSYTFQLYFDFSGYTDMAWGAALLFGIQLPQNFNSPYKAHSIQEFWRRWHMTLSRFLRDYLYIPLGGNKRGKIRTFINLFLTFLLGGLWHGAAWTFVAWGALHGAALVIERLIRNAGLKLPRQLSIPLTFLFVNVAWVFFRANSFLDARRVIGAMFQPMTNFWSFNQVHIDLTSLFWFLLAFVVAFTGKNSNEWTGSLKSNRRNLIVMLVLFVISILHLNRLSEFIYFQF